MKISWTLFLLVAAAGLASAQTQAPEIDGGSAATALALLGGALLVFRASRKK